MFHNDNDKGKWLIIFALLPQYTTLATSSLRWFATGLVLKEF